MSLSLVQSLIGLGLDSEMCRFVWDERRIFCQKDYDVSSNKVYPDKTPKLKKKGLKIPSSVVNTEGFYNILQAQAMYIHAFQ